MDTQQFGTSIWDGLTCFPVSGITTGAEQQLLTRAGFIVVDFAFLSHTSELTCQETLRVHPLLHFFFFFKTYMGKLFTIKTAWEGSFSLHQLRGTRSCSEARDNMRARNCIIVLLGGSRYSTILVGNTGSVSLLKLRRLSGVTCSLSSPSLSLLQMKQQLALSPSSACLSSLLSRQLKWPRT